MKVTSTEFQRNVGHDQDVAQREPVAVTRDGRPHTVLVSAALFELFASGRIARLVEDLDEDTLHAIACSAVPDEFAEVDKLLADWKPPAAPGLLRP